MYKLATAAVVVAALAAPAAAIGHRAMTHKAPAASSCSDGPVFLSTKNYTFCGPQVFSGTATVWVRDAETGKSVAVPGARWKAQPPYGP